MAEVAGSETEFQETWGTIQIKAGFVAVEIDGVADSASTELQLSYIPPGGERQVVPPALFLAARQFGEATTDSSGLFQIRGLPTIGESLWVESTAGQGEFSGISQAIHPIPGAIVDAGPILVKGATK